MKTQILASAIFLSLTACSPLDIALNAVWLIDQPMRVSEPRRNPANSNCFWGNYADVRESKEACEKVKGEWRK